MHQRRRKNIIYLANERNTTNSSNLTDRNDVKSLERRYVSLSQNLFFFFFAEWSNADAILLRLC